MSRNRTMWVWAVASLGIVGFVSARAQTQPSSVQPQVVTQAQTVRIPLQAMEQGTALPVKDLQPADLTLFASGKPAAFQLSRPWDQTVNPKTGRPADTPNVLIVLPLGDPVLRANALAEAIRALSTQPKLDWNISILDDSGNQTPYTRDIKSVIADLRTVQSEPPQDLDLTEWRKIAAQAIAGMRELPGRRIVLSLGDLFHEIFFSGNQLVYDNFQLQDVASAARNAGATIYCADSFSDIEAVRQMYPDYSVTGTGPWLVRAANGDVAGWITGTIADTMHQIERDAMGAYTIDLHLAVKQMDGQPRSVAVTARRPTVFFNVPPYFVAPDLAQLEFLSKLSPKLRDALQNPPPAGSSPLQLATQLNYFPHADGNGGTQVATTQFFWNKSGSPPQDLSLAATMTQTTVGYLATVMKSHLHWDVEEPAWNATFEVRPGAYNLRIVASDPAGNAIAATSTPFSVDSSSGEQVLISSLVLGKVCIFVPTAHVAVSAVDNLRAGNCDVRPNATGIYSPHDVVWTLVRVTPTGKLTGKPAKDWKANFRIVDANGSKLAQEPVRWLPAADGSFVATAAFQLSDAKLKLTNAQYAVVFQLKGPGISGKYEENTPFLMSGIVPGQQ